MKTPHPKFTKQQVLVSSTLLVLVSAMMAKDAFAVSWSLSFLGNDTYSSSATAYPLGNKIVISDTPPASYYSGNGKLSLVAASGALPFQTIVFSGGTISANGQYPYSSAIGGPDGSTLYAGGKVYYALPGSPAFAAGTYYIC
ncbi:MAG: hypothetical protein WCL08_14065, partial [Verrucomicrobiota bacterium]